MNTGWQIFQISPDYLVFSRQWETAISDRSVKSQHDDGSSFLQSLGPIKK